MPRPLMCLLCLLMLGLFVAPVAAVEEDEEDADYLPGLSAVYSSGKKTIRRIDPDIEFVWGTASLDPRLPAGPFQAKWQGRLLLQEPSTYRFFAYVQGQVTITLDGKEVLSGKQQQPGWINGPPLEFDFGEFELDVQYKKTGKAGQLKLFWSADRFDREPLPARFLYRNDIAADLKQIERGQTAFAAHRCNRCHR
ncbi:PA14 domain-containing protein, partial [Symmachiella dynata]|uniref:PA14 domain-containing protein n=1 Tax=Symmachiella dynata TaxID=2527995 RepID=UPI0030EC1E4E